MTGPVVNHQETIPISREGLLRHRGEIVWQGVVYRYEYAPVALRLDIWRVVQGSKSIARYSALHAAVKKHYARKP